MQYKKEPCYSLFAMVVIGTMILGFDYVAPVKKIVQFVSFVTSSSPCASSTSQPLILADLMSEFIML